MSKAKKLVLLFFTLWPLLYLIFMFPYFWSLSLLEITQLSLTVVALQLVTMVILVALIIIYAYHLSHNPLVDDQSKLMWLFGIIFAEAIVTIFYWIKFIWGSEQLE